MQISMEEGLAVAGGLVFVVLILVALVCWCDRGDRDSDSDDVIESASPGKGLNNPQFASTSDDSADGADGSGDRRSTSTSTGPGPKRPSEYETSAGMAARAQEQTLLGEDTGNGNGDGAAGDGDGDPPAAAASGPVYDMAARSDGTGNTPGPKQTTDDGPVYDLAAANRAAQMLRSTPRPAEATYDRAAPSAAKPGQDQRDDHSSRPTSEQIFDTAVDAALRAGNTTVPEHQSKSDTSRSEPTSPTNRLSNQSLMIQRVAPPGYARPPGYVKVSAEDPADAEAAAAAAAAPGFDADSDSDIGSGFGSDVDVDAAEGAGAARQRGDAVEQGGVNGFFDAMLEVDKPAATPKAPRADPSPADEDGEVEVSSSAFVTSTAGAPPASPGAVGSKTADDEEIYDAETCAKMSAALGKCPPFAPPLPAWMQPDDYDPWATARRRPIYRTVVCQRNNAGDLGFGIAVKNSDLVVQRTDASWLPDSVIDGDEVLGVKGSAVDRENVVALLQGAGLTGAGFSVDIIRYVIERETRSVPKPADPSWTLGDMVGKLGNRLGLEQTEAKHKIKGIGVVEAMQIGSLETPEQRTALLTDAIDTKVVGLGAKVQAEYVEKVYRCPARHYALISNVGPKSRKMLTFEAGALLTVFNKSKAWWAASVGDGNTTGWFPSYAVHPYPAGSGTAAAATADTDTRHREPGAFTEAAMTDPLYSIEAWWTAHKEPLSIDWPSLLPTRHHPICACNVNTRIGKTKQVITFSLKFSDASKSDVKVVVDHDKPTITEEWQPPPALRSYVTLKKFATRFGRPLTSYCESRIGTQIGNGQCWTLVDEALKHVGARRPLNFNFGQVLAETDATEGDIVHFSGCKFVARTADGSTKTTTVGMPDHTGVVKCREGRLYTVWDCNISGNKTIQESTYNLMDLQGGNLKFYRALPAYETLKGKRGKGF